MKAMPDVIKQAARKLRKNMTLAEESLWKDIRQKQLLNKQFQKQKPIYVYTEDSGLARYIIADFYCSQHQLVIELDGSIHNLPEILALDSHKEMLLTNKGYKVIRFRNDEVLNNRITVLKTIEKHLE